MKFFDENENVLEWQSEEKAISYFDPSTGRCRRYFPDFIVKFRQIDGSIKTVMIEIKPWAQTQPPKIKKKPSPSYVREVFTWAQNSAKWESARAYCEKRGMEFRIITEKELFNG